MAGDQMRRAAVLGSPIAHSLSPVLHRAAYRALGLDWSYDAIECDERALARLLGNLDDSWAGLSLTMPLKRAVLPLLDEVSPAAAEVGAANTVVLDGGRRAGFNTDVSGMVDALNEAGVTRVRSAVVLGAGATAGSAVAALHRMGLSEVAVAARTPARAGDLRTVADRLEMRLALHRWEGLAGLLPTDVLVSTVPAGAADAVAAIPDLPARCHAVFDVVYDPWPTALAAAAYEAGSHVVPGFSLLLHQAARQVELMTGFAQAPLEAMRAAGDRALARRQETH